VRSSDDVHEYLTEKGIPHRIVELATSSRTAALAADALDVAVSDVVKSLLFVVDETRPVLALVSGDASVDTGMLADEVGAAETRLAKAGEVRAVTGYRPGAVPPCALATEVPVVADPGVLCPEVVYCGGGTKASMLRIRSADLVAVVRPAIRPIAKRQAELLQRTTGDTPTDATR
jgi:Cys-tRNA(Pro) deacylase